MLSALSAGLTLVRLLKVSEGADTSVYRYEKMEERNRRTVEYRVGDQTTRIDSFRPRRIRDLRHRLTIPTLQIRRTPLISLQLVRIVTLHISPMVLIEVRKLVVEEHGRLDIVWDFELDDALLLLADVCLSRVVEEGILWCGARLLVRF